MSPDAVDKNKDLVSDALGKGARLLYGNPNVAEEFATRIRPTIVENVTKEMDLYLAESFGPTVSLYIVDTEEDAIRLANDTEYGLTTAIFTEDLRRGLRLAGQIESGYEPPFRASKDFTCKIIRKLHFFVTLIFNFLFFV